MADPKLKKKPMRAGVPGRTSKRSPTAATVRVTRRELELAESLYRVAQGEAQWTNGYRTAKLATGSIDDERMYQKELYQWQRVADMKGRYDAALKAYTRAVKHAD